MKVIGVLLLLAILFVGYKLVSTDRPAPVVTPQTPVAEEVIAPVAAAPTPAPFDTPSNFPPPAAPSQPAAKTADAELASALDRQTREREARRYDNVASNLGTLEMERRRVRCRDAQQASNSQLERAGSTPDPDLVRRLDQQVAEACRNY